MRTLLLVALPLLSGLARAGDLDVFVLTGQSNALGTTADPDEPDPDPGRHPADAAPRFFWSNRSTRAGDGAAVLIGDSGGRIRRLAAQQGEGASATFWGPELGFGRALYDAGERDFLIVKAARAGGGNRFWAKGAGDDHMYRHVADTVRAALEALPRGTHYEVRALLYLQGESDGEDEARLAGERLAALAHNLRADLPRATELRVLVGEIAAPGARRDVVRRQQRALADSDPRVEYVPTLDLADHLYDGLHFDKEAKLEIGRRFARAWLDGRRVAFETSFEEHPPGPFERLAGEGYALVAPTGAAEIDAEHRRSGTRCLRILGGEEQAVELVPALDRRGIQRLSFWAERWTRRAPFAFRVEALSSGRWRPVHDGTDELAVGGFHTFVDLELADARAERLRLVASAPPGTGVLVDDLRLSAPARMRVRGARSLQTVRPALIGKEHNPVAHLAIEVEGDLEPRRLVGLSLSTAGTGELEDVERVRVFSTGRDPSFSSATPFGRPAAPAAELVFRGRQPLADGTNHLWVSFELAPDADLHRRVDARCTALELDDGSVLEPTDERSGRGLRIGVALRDAGDDGVPVYRIPGLATTNAGTLIAVYDVRHHGWGDLPGDVDVGASRSTDGGRTWEDMRIALDMGAPHDQNGVGDPSILVDHVTGTVWIAALWSKGNRGWNGSGPGLEPEETGQLVLAKSTDDGRTWSGPLNVTRQVKRPEWRLLLQSPGRGISLRDGTLVFPAQFLDADGLPHATLLYSRDHGQSWALGTAARPNTTESRVVELADGALMLNMRDNRGGSRSVVLTRDLGATWSVHPSSRKALIEPVCNAGLILFPAAGEGGTDLLVFCNPHVDRPPRRDMTLQVSTDEGLTWPAEHRLLLSELSCAGYSSLTVIDADTLGVLYEGGAAAHLVFESVPRAELLSRR